MAIVHMGDNQATDFADGAFCPIQWTGKEWQDGYGNLQGLRVAAPAGLEGRSRALVLYTTHHGLCISERECNMHDDSDFFMTVWDWEAMAPYEMCFASTRGWSYPCYGSSVDATADVIEAYNEWRNRKAAEACAFNARCAARKIIDGISTPHKGAQIIVKRGRKVKPGLTGRVLGLTERKSYTGEREVWALLDTGKGFESVQAKHCDVIAADPSYAQAVFDLADSHHGGNAAAQWHYAYGHAS